MKSLITILLTCFLSSCTAQIDSKLILGSWKMKNVTDYTKMNATDRVTFYKNGSVYIEILTNGQIFSRLKGKYKIDINTKVLTIMYFNDNKHFNSEILKLTETEMELKREPDKQIIRYIRF